MLERRTRACIAGVAILFLSIGLAFAAPEQQPNGGANNQVATNGPAEPTPESREASATEVIARYTVQLSWFTGALAVIGVITSGLVLWQILLARREFHATHRPRLEVRFVREVAGGVQITVINSGTGSANFIEARAVTRHLLPGEPLPSPHDIPADSAFTLRRRFNPSESDTYVIPPAMGEQAAFEAGFGGPLHVFGWIVYETAGATPVRRTTYFGRKVEILQPELVLVEGTDWNFIQ